MKTLQNNFTTPEQSKRLLELGVPVWTADGQYNDFNGNILVLPDWSVFSPIYENNTRKPCWSVGRLMEIIDICALGENSDPNTEEYPSTIKVMNKLHITYVEYLVKSMERAAQLGTIDFSKLEE